MARKRKVEWEGREYTIRSDTLVIPDLKSMDRLDVLIWLNRNTYSRGYQKQNPLAGIGTAISLKVG